MGEGPGHTPRRLRCDWGIAPQPADRLAADHRPQIADLELGTWNARKACPESEGVTRMNRTMGLGGVLLFFLSGCGGELDVPTALDGAIQVDGGWISGAVGGEGSDVRVYKGIPYATAPVGELRWKAPQPVVPWDGVREGSEFSPTCSQPVRPGSSAAERQSEDCLYLNVWTRSSEPDGNRPVMVWIHGGTLRTGSGSRPFYDGTSLAGQGVVLVTINYRLGPLGFLAHPALSQESEHNSSGNYGLLDQIAALQWVQRNISSFGGDPNRVTIFGESAGSWSVCYLMATPLAKGLFHRVIGESGGSFGPMRHLKEDQPSMESAERIGQRFASALGANPEEDVLVFLRGKIAEELIEAFSPFAQEGIILRPNTDGWAFPRDVYTIFAQGEQSDVPVIVGSNADEGTIFAERRAAQDRAAYLGRIRDKYGSLESDFLETYPISNDEEAKQALLGEIRDELFTWQMRTWARMMDTVTSQAYLYYFSHSPPRPNQEQLGASHGAEIPYVFDNLDRTDWSLRETDRHLADMMSRYWVNFAHKGDPSGVGLVEWPAYDRNEETHMEFSNTAKKGKGFLTAEFEFFDKYFSQRRTRTHNRKTE